jgi:hypothetical protein
MIFEQCHGRDYFADVQITVDVETVVAENCFFQFRFEAIVFLDQVDPGRQEEINAVGAALDQDKCKKYHKG